MTPGSSTGDRVTRFCLPNTVSCLPSSGVLACPLPTLWSCWAVSFNTIPKVVGEGTVPPDLRHSEGWHVTWADKQLPWD